MADQSTDPTPALEKLHLDEVTGEQVSKSELKKRVKQRANEERKAGKATQAAQNATENPASNQTNKNAEADESNLTPNVSSSLAVVAVVVVDSY